MPFGETAKFNKDIVKAMLPASGFESGCFPCFIIMIEREGLFVWKKLGVWRCVWKMQICIVSSKTVRNFVRRILNGAVRRARLFQNVGTTAGFGGL